MSGHAEGERGCGRCAGYGWDEPGVPTDYTVLNYAMRGAIEFLPRWQPLAPLAPSVAAIATAHKRVLKNAWIYSSRSIVKISIPDNVFMSTD